MKKIYGFDDTKKELWMQFATKEEYQQMEQKLFQMLLSSDGNDQVVIYLSKEKAIKTSCKQPECPYRATTFRESSGVFWRG